MAALDGRAVHLTPWHNPSGVCAIVPFRAKIEAGGEPHDGTTHTIRHAGDR